MDKPEHSSRMGFFSLTAGVLLSVFVVYQFVFDPFGRTLAKLNSDIRAAELKLVQSRQKIAGRVAVEDEYKKYEPVLRDTASSDRQAMGLSNEVEALVRNAGLSLLDIKPLPEKDGGFYREYAVDLNVRGPMSGLVSFLHELGGTKRLLRVRSILLRPTDRLSSSLQARIQVTGIGSAEF